MGRLEFSCMLENPMRPSVAGRLAGDVGEWNKTVMEAREGKGAGMG